MRLFVLGLLGWLPLVSAVAIRLARIHVADRPCNRQTADFIVVHHEVRRGGQDD